MIYGTNHTTAVKSPCLDIESFRSGFSQPCNNKVTDVFKKSYNNKLNVSQHLCMKRPKAKHRIKDQPDDVPAGVAIGLVEIFAGSLACIVPIPGFRVVGGILIGDGIKRVADEGQRLEQNNTGGGMWPSEVPRPVSRSADPS